MPTLFELLSVGNIARPQRQHTLTQVGPTNIAAAQNALVNQDSTGSANGLNIFQGRFSDLFSRSGGDSVISMDQGTVVATAARNIALDASASTVVADAGGELIASLRNGSRFSLGGNNVTVNADRSTGTVVASNDAFARTNDDIAVVAGRDVGLVIDGRNTNNVDAQVIAGRNAVVEANNKAVVNVTAVQDVVANLNTSGGNIVAGRDADVRVNNGVAVITAGDDATVNATGSVIDVTAGDDVNATVKDSTLVAHAGDRATVSLDNSAAQVTGHDVTATQVKQSNLVANANTTNGVVDVTNVTNSNVDAKGAAVIVQNGSNSNVLVREGTTLGVVDNVDRSTIDMNAQNNVAANIDNGVVLQDGERNSAQVDNSFVTQNGRQNDLTITNDEAGTTDNNAALMIATGDGASNRATISSTNGARTNASVAMVASNRGSFNFLNVQGSAVNSTATVTQTANNTGGANIATFGELSSADFALLNNWLGSYAIGLAT